MKIIVNMLHLPKEFLLFLYGGVGYMLIEFLYRGYSHPSMFILGGLCFIIIGAINETFPWCMPLVSQMTISAVTVTALELIFGFILNIWLKLDVWDYSNMPYNFYGQICLLFSIFWFFLSLVAIFIDDWLRFKLYDEEFPSYCIFYCTRHSDLMTK